MEKLKPCPFCGGEASIQHEYSSESGDWYAVDCLNKKCPMEIVIVTTGWRPTKDEAIEAWNTRYERTVTLKGNGHCPDCNRLVGKGERYCAYCGARAKEESDANQR